MNLKTQGWIWICLFCPKEACQAFYRIQIYYSEAEALVDRPVNKLAFKSQGHLVHDPKESGVGSEIGDEELAEFKVDLEAGVIPIGIKEEPDA